MENNGTMYSRAKHAGEETSEDVCFDGALRKLEALADNPHEAPCLCCLPAWRGDNGSKLDLVYDRNDQCLIVVSRHNGSRRVLYHGLAW